LKVAWLPRTKKPDSWYRVHGTDHYGAKLHSEEGYINSVEMLLDLRDELQRYGLITTERLEQISRVIFGYALLRLIDCKRYQVIHTILSKCKEHQLFAKPQWNHLNFYLNLRKLSRFSANATFYVNQLARKRLLPFAFQASELTYDTIPTTPPEPHILNS
jgi:hypothetical protein